MFIIVYNLIALELMLNWIQWYIGVVTEHFYLIFIANNDHAMKCFYIVAN